MKYSVILAILIIAVFAACTKQETLVSPVPIKVDTVVKKKDYTDNDTIIASDTINPKLQGEISTRIKSIEIEPVNLIQLVKTQNNSDSIKYNEYNYSTITKQSFYINDATITKDKYINQSLSLKYMQDGFGLTIELNSALNLVTNFEFIYKVNRQKGDHKKLETIKEVNIYKFKNMKPIYLSDSLVVFDLVSNCAFVGVDTLSGEKLDSYMYIDYSRNKTYYDTYTSSYEILNKLDNTSHLYVRLRY